MFFSNITLNTNYTYAVFVLRKNILCVRNSKYFRKFKFPFLMLLSVYSSHVLAVDLSITIKNSETDAYVEEATVVVNSEKFTTTNEFGVAQFKDVTMPVKIKVLAFGFQEEIFEEKQKTSLVLYISPLVVEAEGLEVVVDRIEDKTSKLTMQADEIKKAPGALNDPLLSIQSLPGIAAQEGSNQVFIRGSGTKDNLYYVNDAPIKGVFHFDDAQSTINPDLISDFNIFLSAFPANYGDGLGGVIDINLRNPRKDRLHQSYNLGFDQIAALVEGPVGEANNKSSFAVAVKKSLIHYIVSADKINENIDENENSIVVVPRYQDGQALFHRDLDNGFVDLLYYGSLDKRGMLIKEDTKIDPETAGELDDKNEFHNLSVNWKHNYKDSLAQNIILALSQEDNTTTGGKSLDTGGHFFYNEKIDKIYFRPSLTYRLRDWSTLFFGVELAKLYNNYNMYAPATLFEEENNLNPDDNISASEKVSLKGTLNYDQYASYIKHRHRWNNRLVTTAGLRYSTVTNDDQIDMSGLSPRFSLEYNIATNTLVTVGWGHYFQEPEFIRLVKRFGNPKLQFMEAEHSVIGIRQKFDKYWSAKVELYEKRMSNLVASLPNSNQPYQYANIGSGRSRGVDLFIKRELSERKMGWFSYSFSQSERKNDLSGDEASFSSDQPHTLKMVWRQPFQRMLGLKFKGWSWGVKLEMRSGRPYTPVVDRQQQSLADGTNYWRPIYGEFNSARLPVYKKLDLRLDKVWHSGRGKFGFYAELQNVLNTKNVIDYKYGDNLEHIDKPVEVTGMPIFPVAGFTLEF